MVLLLLLTILYVASSVETSPLGSNALANTEVLTLRGISRQNVTVNKGDNFTLSVFVERSIHAVEEKWMKKTIFAPRITNTSEVILEGFRHSLYSHDAGNGSAIKTLDITQSSTTDSGIYVYAVRMKDYVKTMEFEVIVESMNAAPRLFIMSPTSYIQLNQKIYPRRTEILVLCLIEAYSVSSGTPVALQYRNSKLSMLVDPPEGSLTKVTGTFEKGFQWTIQLTERYNEFKCSDKANSKNFVTESLASDYEVPEVSIHWNQRKTASEIEDHREIYEGDDVDFVWKTAKNEENWIPSNVTWMYNNQILSSFVNSVDNQSNSISYVIKNISHAQSGDYVCLSLLHGVDTEYKRTIKVLEIEKPYRTSQSPEKTIELSYDSAVIFTCEMDGIPRPQYIWIKDGKVFRGGKGLSIDNYTLTITRLTAEDSGEFACTAVNRAGTEQYKFSIKVNDAPERISTLYLGLFLFVLWIVLGCLAIALLKYWKQRRQTVMRDKELSVLFRQLNGSSENEALLKFDPTIPINQLKQRLQYNKQYEIERDNLQIGDKLGSGEFGEVWFGWLRKPRNSISSTESENRLAVAVKGARSLLNPTHCQMLVDELRTFCAIGKHPNVLALVGAVTKTMQSGELLIAMELCERGSLKDYLLGFHDKFINELRMVAVQNDYYVNSRQTIYAVEENPNYASDVDQNRLQDEKPSFLATSDLISFALQVASGVEHLASIPCIHRDLAARNVLLTNRGICKVADFGMARNEEYYKFGIKNDVPAPFRWMAVEAIELGSYTEKTDIWSFGILLYEIFTLGAIPYASIQNEDLLEKLQKGHRNAKPQYCHDGIYDLMKQCTDAHPHLRPDFTTCVSVLKQHLKLASPQLFERIAKEVEEERNRQELLPDGSNRKRRKNIRQVNVC